MARVTVVNDNPEFLELMEDVLEDERYETTTIDGAREDAVELVRASRPEILVLDLRMGTESMHGWDVAEAIRSETEFRGLPILLCSADAQALKEIEDRLEGERSVEILSKPFGLDELFEAIDRLLRAARAD